jgi:Protein of unknown function (DUF3303)
LSQGVTFSQLAIEAVQRTLPFMLFMVIEHFKQGDPAPIGQRFRENGRMLPEGVNYHASWLDSEGARCFQVMEASDPGLLNSWVQRWSDLIDFEIVPIETSADFWSKRQDK